MILSSRTRLRCSSWANFPFSAINSSYVPVSHGFPLLHHDDAVGVADGGKAVCDDKGRTDFHELGDRFLHVVFRHVVERAGRFVHDEDAGFADERPRDADALFLTAGQLVAVFADLRFQAVRQRGQKFGNIRVLHRLPELLFAVLFQAVSDVLADGSGKEDAVLRHDGDEMAVILNGNFVQGHAVDEDVPLRRFEQPDEEIDDRALA